MRKELRCFQTASGRVEVVSLTEFIQNIKLRQWPDKTDHVQVIVRTKPTFHCRTGISLTVPGIRCENLFFQSSHEFNRLIDDLSKGIHINMTPKDIDLVHMAHDITMQSACEMGDPTCIVRLGPRLWMAADPKNFEVHYSFERDIYTFRYAIANYYPAKSIIWQVERPCKV